MQILINGMT